MGNALQAYANFSGAIEFYTYALMLNPTYREAFHSLMVVKCAHQVVQGRKNNKNFDKEFATYFRENKSSTESTPSIMEFFQDGAVLYTVKRGPSGSDILDSSNVASTVDSDG